jgi:hypothetical protein
MSLQLNDMVDSFFGYFGNFIGASLSAFIFAQPLDNKLRIQLQKNNFFQKNYRLRYLLVAPILAIPSKKNDSFKKSDFFFCSSWFSFAIFCESLLSGILLDEIHGRWFTDRFRKPSKTKIQQTKTKPRNI